jgi:hypothetical protein
LATIFNGSSAAARLLPVTSHPPNLNTLLCSFNLNTSLCVDLVRTRNQQQRARINTVPAFFLSALGEFRPFCCFVLSDVTTLTVQTPPPDATSSHGFNAELGFGKHSFPVV